MTPLVAITITLVPAAVAVGLLLRHWLGLDRTWDQKEVDDLARRNREPRVLP